MATEYDKIEKWLASNTLVARFVSAEDIRGLPSNKIDILCDDSITFNSFLYTPVLPLAKDAVEGTFYILPNNTLNYVINNQWEQIVGSDAGIQKVKKSDGTALPIDTTDMSVTLPQDDLSDGFYFTSQSLLTSIGDSQDIPISDISGFDKANLVLNETAVYDATGTVAVITNLKNATTVVGVTMTTAGAAASSGKTFMIRASSISRLEGGYNTQTTINTSEILGYDANKVKLGETLICDVDGTLGIITAKTANNVTATTILQSRFGYVVSTDKTLDLQKNSITDFAIDGVYAFDPISLYGRSTIVPEKTLVIDPNGTLGLVTSSYNDGDGTTHVKTRTLSSAAAAGKCFQYSAFDGDIGETISLTSSGFVDTWNQYLAKPNSSLIWCVKGYVALYTGMNSGDVQGKIIAVPNWQDQKILKYWGTLSTLTDTPRPINVSDIDGWQTKYLETDYTKKILLYDEKGTISLYVGRYGSATQILVFPLTWTTNPRPIRKIVDYDQTAISRLSSVMPGNTFPMAINNIKAADGTTDPLSGDYKTGDKFFTDRGDLYEFYRTENATTISLRAISIPEQANLLYSNDYHSADFATNANQWKSYVENWDCGQYNDQDIKSNVRIGTMVAVPDGVLARIDGLSSAEGNFQMTMRNLLKQFNVFKSSKAFSTITPDADGLYDLAPEDVKMVKSNNTWTDADKPSSHKWFTTPGSAFVFDAEGSIGLVTKVFPETLGTDSEIRYGVTLISKKSGGMNILTYNGQFSPSGNYGGSYDAGYFQVPNDDLTKWHQPWNYSGEPAVTLDDFTKNQTIVYDGLGNIGVYVQNDGDYLRFYNIQTRKERFIIADSLMSTSIFVGEELYLSPEGCQLWYDDYSPYEPLGETANIDRLLAYGVRWYNKHDTGEDEKGGIGVYIGTGKEIPICQSANGENDLVYFNGLRGDNEAFIEVSNVTSRVSGHTPSVGDILVTHQSGWCWQIIRQFNYRPQGESSTKQYFRLWNMRVKPNDAVNGNGFWSKEKGDVLRFKIVQKPYGQPRTRDIRFPHNWVKGEMIDLGGGYFGIRQTFSKTFTAADLDSQDRFCGKIGNFMTEAVTTSSPQTMSWGGSVKVEYNNGISIQYNEQRGLVFAGDLTSTGNNMAMETGGICFHRTNEQGCGDYEFWYNGQGHDANGYYTVKAEVWVTFWLGNI